MAYKFVREDRAWVEYQQLPDIVAIDFHMDRRHSDFSPPYWEKMELVSKRSLSALHRAQTEGKKYVLFTHGHSTSHVGKTTSRSQVRKVMLSKEATPYIIRKNCIQHVSVFVAAIKPLNGTFKAESAKELMNQFDKKSKGS